jgi:hypothetical protein
MLCAWSSQYSHRPISARSVAQVEDQTGTAQTISPSHGRAECLDVPHLLQENIETTNLALTAEDLKEIDSALSGFKVHGGRMNAEQMKVVEA